MTGDLSSQRTPITRIDIINLPNHQGVRIEKYRAGWTAGSRSDNTATNKEMTFDEIAGWLATNGWKVYTWPACHELGIEQGARAFRPHPMPVRTKAEILRRRSELQERLERILPRRRDPYTGQIKPLPINLSSVDLAYQL